MTHTTVKILILLFASITQLSAQKQMIQYGKLGIVSDDLKTVLLPFEYDEFDSGNNLCYSKSLTEGLFSVRKGDLWGYVSTKTFKEVIPCMYYRASRFKRGVAVVETKKRIYSHLPIVNSFILINTFNQMVSVNTFDYICSPFYQSERLNVIIDKKVGFINFKGDILIPARFYNEPGLGNFYKSEIDSTIYCVVNTKSEYYDSDKYTVIDSNGVAVFPDIYSKHGGTYDVTFNQLALKDYSGKWGVLGWSKSSNGIYVYYDIVPFIYTEEIDISCFPRGLYKSKDVYIDQFGNDTKGYTPYDLNKTIKD